MKIPLVILAVVAVLLGAFYLLAPAPDPDAVVTRTDLPWQVEVLPDGTSRVFDLHLGEATLDDAIGKFGPYENMAVFQSEAGKRSLEAYFGKVSFGPLEARVVTALDVPDDELEALVDRAVERKGSPTGDWKFMLDAADQGALRARTLRSVTYIPTYRGLEADFFRERFGEPGAWKTLGKHAVQWFYPDRGLSMVLDTRGQEALEFVVPRTMRVPEDAHRATAQDGTAAPGRDG
jgi:hypothetical protein